MKNPQKHSYLDLLGLFKFKRNSSSRPPLSSLLNTAMLMATIIVFIFALLLNLISLGFNQEAVAQVYSEYKTGKTVIVSD